MATRAVVLLSGGLDSTTVLHAALADGLAVHAISFDYGQRHRVELDAARAIARGARVDEHRVVSIDLGGLGGSALTDPTIAVPTDHDERSIGTGIPVTYVPARNTIFLAHAVAFAEVRGIRDIFIGVNHLDYSGYPDCRPEFLRAFEQAANLGTRAGVSDAGVRIRAPLVELTKAAIIRRGLALGVDYARTISCYQPTAAGEACGRCDACVLRLRGFAEAGATDPGRYVSGSPRS